MANILISIATLILTVMVATYGAYTGHHAFKRSQYTAQVGHSFERLLVYVTGVRDDLGRVPGVADVPTTRLTLESVSGVTFSYGVSGGHGYVCAQATRQPFLDEAFQIVANQRPGALYGAACDTTGGPSGATVSVTVRIS